MESSVQPAKPNSQTDPSINKQGCSGLVAFVFISIWIIVASIIAQVIHWSLVFTIFEGSIKMPDLRWAVQLGYGLSLFIPLLAARFLVRNTLYRERFKSLILIALIAVFLAFPRVFFLTDWQTSVFFQIVVFIISIIGFTFFLRKKHVDGIQLQPSIKFLPIAGAAGAVIGVPWVLWGAQGSVVETVLALILAGLIGLVAGKFMLFSFSGPEAENGIVAEKPGLLGTGWTATLGLLVMATSIDQVGNGWLITLSVLPLGYAMAALALNSEKLTSTAGRAASGVLAGMGFLWPILLVDPDELSPIIASGTGELLEYATQSAFVGFGLALLVMVFFLIFRKKLHSSPSILLTGGILFLFAWIGLFSLYGFSGQTGFHGEKIFIIFKDQANIAQFSSITDPVIRRQSVYKALVEHAESTQKGLREVLDSRNLSYTPYYLVNAIAVEADPLLRAQLTNRSDVDRILDNPILRPLPESVPESSGFEFDPIGYTWNLNLIGAELVHTELGITGEGIIVGQSDSGAQGDHPEYAARYRGVLDGSDDYNWFDPWYESKSPVDIGGHGTHTLGTIVGENVGVAPGAQWIGCVNLGRNLGNPSLYLDCMQFMLAPFPQNGDPFADGDPARGAQVLNNSWGCPDVEGCDPETFAPAMRALRIAGVFVVASAGNSGAGGCETVQDPIAIYEDAYSVGAVDSSGTLAYFSSMGPVTVDGSRRTKPDILAPGVGVMSSFPGTTYEENSGTSMAGPHVVGVVALMWSANPHLIGNIDRTREILNQTADPYSGSVPECASTSGLPNNAGGYGIVNAFKAVQMSLEEK
jgi:subtilisin family serine protease